MSLRISDLPGLSIRRPTLIVVVNLLIAIAGLSALFAIEVRELPDVDRPVVMVRAFFDGASPETMDAEVTSVIEGAVARVSGVKAINSASEENNARIRAEFSPNVKLDVAANDVREAVARIARRLPDGVEDVIVIKADTDASPIIRLALLSTRLPQEALTRLAEDDVSAELSAIPGIATVQLFGDQEPVLRIVVEPIGWRPTVCRSTTSPRRYVRPTSMYRSAASSPTASSCWCAPTPRCGGRPISKRSN